MKAQFFKPSELRARSAKLTNFTASSAESSRVALANAVNESVKQKVGERFDAFLSYSSLDWPVVYGLYLALVEKGLSVYVDRVQDIHLDRANVTTATAEQLRGRMRQCRSLLFATTENFSNSKWMPWEIGYFDGFGGKVAIVPVTESNDFTGQEYLGLYPVMESNTWLRNPDGTLFVQAKNWVAR